MSYNIHIVKFEEVLQNTENKTFLIESEIKYLEFFIHTDLTYGADHPFRDVFQENKIFNVDYNRDSFLMDFFYKILHNDYKFNIENHHGNKYIETTFYNALELTVYHKYLKDLLNNHNKKPKQNSSDLTHKQKMLALHYLGLDLSKNENTSSAKILSQILDLDYDNTRKYLSYISSGKNQVRTKANLQKIQKLFENQSFNEISSKIKEDIEKL